MASLYTGLQALYAQAHYYSRTVIVTPPRFNYGETVAPLLDLMLKFSTRYFCVNGNRIKQFTLILLKNLAYQHQASVNRNVAYLLVNYIY